MSVLSMWGPGLYEVIDASPPAASIAHSGTRKASQQGGSFPDDFIFVAALQPKFVVSSAVRLTI